jgi:hypothetical protein
MGESVPSKYAPNSLTPLPTIFTAGSLGYEPINNYKPDGLFSDIVSWVNSGNGNKLEVAITIVLKSIPYVLSVLAKRNVMGSHIQNEE